MQIIPVLDILNRVVVRGVAGQRDRYEPIQSAVCFSPDPIEVATVFRDRFGLDKFYIADLDAILHGEPNYWLFDELSEAGFELMVDAGASQPIEVQGLLTRGAAKAVIGLETWPLLSSLEMLQASVGPERLVFSLDLKHGQPLRVFKDLSPESAAIDIGAAVLSTGIRELIVLDLASVGVHGGVPTLDLCEELKSFAPRTRIITGGGVRDVRDLETLSERGVDGVLVASALHDEKLSIDDVKKFA